MCNITDVRELDRNVSYISFFKRNNEHTTVSTFVNNELRRMRVHLSKERACGNILDLS